MLDHHELCARQCLKIPEGCGSDKVWSYQRNFCDASIILTRALSGLQKVFLVCCMYDLCE